MKRLLKRLTDRVFDPLWERFGRAEPPTSEEVKRFQREREAWLTRARYQQRWESERRR